MLVRQRGGKAAVKIDLRSILTPHARNSSSWASQRPYWSYFIWGKLDTMTVQRECRVAHLIKAVIWPLKTLSKRPFKAILSVPTAIKAVEPGRNQIVFRAYLDEY